MSKSKNIPLKNYIILVIISLVTVILVLYINVWFQTYKENKISISPFSGVVEEVNINEINVTFSEMNEVILYLGYTNDQRVYNMEERLLKYIKNHNLVDKFIYVNVTDYLENKEYLEIIKSSFEEVSNDIEDAPTLIYVKNGKAEKVINSKDGLLNTYDISNLKEYYDIEN